MNDASQHADPDAARVLAALDAESQPQGEFQHVRQLYVDSFRGQSRFVGVAGFFVTLAFLGLGVWSIVAFFDAEATRDQVLWATLFLFATTQIVMMKVWFWLNMQRNAITREIKRLELRLTAARAGGRTAVSPTGESL